MPQAHKLHKTTPLRHTGQSLFDTSPWLREPLTILDDVMQTRRSRHILAGAVFPSQLQGKAIYCTHRHGHGHGVHTTETRIQGKAPSGAIGRPAFTSCQGNCQSLASSVHRRRLQMKKQLKWLLLAAPLALPVSSGASGASAANAHEGPARIGPALLKGANVINCLPVPVYAQIQGENRHGATRAGIAKKRFIKRRSGEGHAQGPHGERDKITRKHAREMRDRAVRSRAGQNIPMRLPGPRPQMPRKASADGTMAQAR